MAGEQVFMETIDGVVTDLAEFKQRLLASAAVMQSRDQSAEEMLTALSRGYEGHRYAAEVRNIRSRGEHAAGLKYEGDDSKPAADSSGASREGSAGAETSTDF